MFSPYENATRLVAGVNVHTLNWLSHMGWFRGSDWDLDDTLLRKRTLGNWPGHFTQDQSIDRPLKTQRPGHPGFVLVRCGSQTVYLVFENFQNISVRFLPAKYSSNSIHYESLRWSSSTRYLLKEDSDWSGFVHRLDIANIIDCEVKFTVWGWLEVTRFAGITFPKVPPMRFSPVGWRPLKDHKYKLQRRQHC